MNNYKTITLDGVKLFERSVKKPVAISDYGAIELRGADIARESNLNVSFKIDQNKTYTMLKGYLNNKLIPGTEDASIDSYGDFSTGENVYDISRLKNNPVALVNHDNNAGSIAGNYIYLEENEQGLKFKLILRDLEEIHNPITKDAVQAWKSGFGKAFSIAGKFYYDIEKSDPDKNEWALVKAMLHESSLVAIGAEQYSLSSVPDTLKSESEGKEIKNLTLGESVKKWLETKDDVYLEQIEKLKKEKRNG